MRYEASAYFHEDPTTGVWDVVAGYGVWDNVLLDWRVPDGYGTAEDAARAADILNAGAELPEPDPAAGTWKRRAHPCADPDCPGESADLT